MAGVELDKLAKARHERRYLKAKPDGLKRIECFSGDEWLGGMPASKEFKEFPELPGVLVKYPEGDRRPDEYSSRVKILYSHGMTRYELSYLLAQVCYDSREELLNYNDPGVQVPHIIDACDRKDGRYRIIADPTLRRKLIRGYNLEFQNSDTYDRVILGIFETLDSAAVVLFVRQHPHITRPDIWTGAHERGYTPTDFFLPPVLRSPPTVQFENSRNSHNVALQNPSAICWFINLLVPLLMAMLDVSHDTDHTWLNIHADKYTDDMSEQRGWQAFQRSFDDHRGVFTAEDKECIMRKYRFVYLLVVFLRALNNVPKSRYLSVHAVLLRMWATIEDIIPIGDGVRQQDPVEILLRITQIMSDLQRDFPRILVNIGDWNPCPWQFRRIMLKRCEHCNRLRELSNDYSSMITIHLQFQDYLDDPVRVVHPSDFMARVMKSVGTKIPCEFQDCGKRTDVITVEWYTRLGDQVVVLFPRAAGALQSKSVIDRTIVNVEILRIPYGRGQNVRYAYFLPTFVGLGGVKVVGDACEGYVEDTFGHYRGARILYGPRGEGTISINDDSIPFVPVCEYKPVLPGGELCEFSRRHGHKIVCIHYRRMEDEEVAALGINPNERLPAREPYEVNYRG